MAKRILVCAYFAKNLGDDLFLKVLFERYPDTKWDLLTANRNYRSLFNSYKNVKIIYSYREFIIGKKSYNLFFKLNDLLLKYRKYDASLHIGGSIFMQSPAWVKRLKERKYLVSIFNKYNKKSFILGANFGPFNSKGFTREYKKIFPKYEDICFRDNYSYNLFENLHNVRVAPDVVFNLNVEKSNSVDKCVGFSTINLEDRKGLKKYTQQYNDKMVKLVECYIEAGYHVKLFSFCENEGDLKGINEIKSSVNNKYKSKIKIINYTGHLNSFLNEFKRCEIIIGTRFHSLILAMLNNQSFYPLIYSEKTLNLLKDLGMDDKCCHISDVQNLDVNHVIATTNLNKMNNKQVFLDAGKQFKKLDEFIPHVTSSKISASKM